MQTVSSRPVVLLASAMIIGVVLIFSKLGGSGIANYDDCFYAQKGKEILQTGSWMTLYYNGSPSFENPPFFIWLIALSFSVFGVGDFGAIFPSALFGVLTIALVFVFARTLYDDWTAFAASVVLSTTFFFVKYARHAMIDVTLSFFVTLAFFWLLLAIRRDRRYFLLWGAGIGAAVLMKSVLGFFPAFITVIFLLLTGRRRMLADGWFLAGSAIAVVAGCSWYLHQYLSFGSDFLDLHFRWLIFQRGFRHDTAPWTAHLSYLQDILLYYWPWLPVLVYGVYTVAGKVRRRDDIAVLMLCWLLVIPLVMSLMQTRSSWYIMPVYPAAAIICGPVLAGWCRGRARRAAVRGALITGVAAALFINLTPLQLSPEREKDIRAIAPVVRKLRDDGIPVVGYNFDFHSLNNALLFYSDHAAEPVFTDPGELSRCFAGAPRVAALVYTRHRDDVLRENPGSTVLASTESLSLVFNGGSSPGRD